MKINGYTSPAQAGQAQQGRNDAKATDKASAGSSASPAAVTHLNGTSSDGSRDVDTARVAEIRQGIADGRLEFNAERIADKLIENVRDLLDQDKP